MDTDVIERDLMGFEENAVFNVARDIERGNCGSDDDSQRNSKLIDAYEK